MAGEEDEDPRRENLRKEAWMACTSLVLTFCWPQLRSHVKLPGLEKASLCVQEEEARPGIGGHQWSVPRDPQLRDVKSGTGIPLCRELRAQPVDGCVGYHGARDVVCEQMRGQTAHELLSVPSRCDHWGGKAPLRGPRRAVQLRTRVHGVGVEDGRAGTC